MVEKGVCSTWKLLHELRTGWKSFPASQEAVFSAFPLPEELEREPRELVQEDLAGRVYGMKESDGSIARSSHTAQSTACIAYRGKFLVKSPLSSEKT